MNPHFLCFSHSNTYRCLPTFPTNEWCTSACLFVSAVPTMSDAPQLFLFQLFQQWVMHPSFFVCLFQLFPQWMRHPSFFCFSCSNNEWCTPAFCLFVSAVPTMNDAPQLFLFQLFQQWVMHPNFFHPDIYHNAWLGVKYQVTYLPQLFKICFHHSSNEWCTSALF